MAGKKSDHVPGNPLADYLQCKRFIHTTLAGAGDDVTVFTTGMQSPAAFISSTKKKIEVVAWEIHAVTVRPSNYKVSNAYNASPYAATDCSAHFQLAYDAQVAAIDEGNEDFDDYIAGGSFHLDLSTNGANSHFWPMALDIVNPRPVFAEELTFASSTPNVVPVNALEVLVSVWYAPILLEGNQVEMLLAARARL